MKISDIVAKGDVWERAGQLEKAVDWYGQWLKRLSRQKEGAAVAFHQGVVLRKLGKLDQAIAAYELGLRLAPGMWQIAHNLGLAHEAKGRGERAIAVWQVAVQRMRVAGNADACAQLLAHMGRVLEKQEPDKALVLLEESLRLRHTPDATQHFLALRRQMCMWPVVPEWLSELYPQQDWSLQLGPFMALADTDDPEKLGRVVRQFIARKMPQLPTPLPKPPRWQHHRLRIGYLSADFRWHAVSILMAEVLELHDRRRVEVFGLDYSDSTPSPMRQRVVKAFDHHVMLHQMTDEQAARHIRSLEIDVLIDLTGLTASSRWPILAHKPALVQVSYLGFPGVSHIPGMTHVMVDRTLMPADALSSSPEEPIWLEVFQANDRQRKIGETPSRESVGLPQDAMVFCAFNNIFKLTPDVWGVWMRLLRRVPAAVLWMTVDNEGTRQRLKQRAAEAGVAPKRLVFANKVLPDSYLARLRCADVFLDTQPFGAGTTASDALWAGLPVLTCPGRSYASRMAASLLTAMGVDELITPNWVAYEDMAVELGTDNKKLAALKEKLQQARTQSRLFDTPNFVADLENKLMQACAWPTPAECERSAMTHA